jgi:hypothetical protein
MYNEYDLAIVKNEIAFEKAYNEFEILNGMVYLSESGDEQKENSAKASNAFKKVVSSVAKVIESLIDKISSFINNFREKIIKKDVKITLDQDPKESAKRCEEVRKKAASSIDKVASAKTPEACDKIMEEWESEVDKHKKKSSKKVAKAVVITAAAALTAFTALQTSMRMTYKDSIKRWCDQDSNLNREERAFVNKKEKTIIKIITTLKGVLLDEINIPSNINSIINKSGLINMSADQDYNIARNIEKRSVYKYIDNPEFLALRSKALNSIWKSKTHRLG